MITKTCKNCGSTFQVIDSRSSAQFCSKKCRGEYDSKLSKEVRKCEHCGKEFLTIKSSKKKFCSKGCSGKHKTTKVSKVCAVCGKTFYVIKHRENTALYCSRKCADIGQTTDKSPNAVCKICGKPFYRKPSHLSRPKHGKFCSIDCVNIWKQTAYSGEGNHQYGLKGELNASFTGYEIKRKNIKQIDDLVYCPNHPRATKSGRVRKYIIIVEQNYKLFDEKYFYFDGEKHYLKKGVVVHHKDQNHNNNEIENLMPLTISEHTKIHYQLGSYNRSERDKLGRFYNKTAVSKQGELLGTPEEDNQQPSLSGNAFEGSTTNIRTLTSEVEGSNDDTSALPA